MGDMQIQHPFTLPPPPLPPLPPTPSSSKDNPDPPPFSSTDNPDPPPSSSLHESPPRTPPPFDPSRMVGIIRRKALIKDLAAAYHAECLTYCQDLLDLQNKLDEPFTNIKAPEESRKETMRPPKRLKKSR